MTEVIEGEILETGMEFYTHAPSPTLFGTTDPVTVIEKATQTAKALAQVVRDQKLSIPIQGREYVLFEGWTLLGSILGVFPVCVSSTKIEDGWEARVEARTRMGEVLGAAEAECLRSEKTWANRDDYAIRSMAQTRASSKALRMPLGFVMQLAGFEATPADEMPQPSKPSPSSRAADRAAAAVPKKDKAPAMRTRIKELAVEADALRPEGFRTTAAEVEAAFKELKTTLAKANEAELEIVGKDLRNWVDAGELVQFKLVPF